jgi:RNA polymerase sigma factor for flagellar operon FliA
MRLVRKVPKHITVEDLVGYGWVGLMESYQRADPDMPEEEFEAYASYRIRGAMLDYLRTLDPASRDLRRASKKVTEVIRGLTTEHNRPPEEEEIARGLGSSIDEYRTLLQRISQGGLARLEVLDLDQMDVETDSPTIDEDVGRRELGGVVAQAIETLPPKLQQILALYYQEDCTLREIGLVLGVTESRVCQLHSEAMHRLRARIGRH